MKLLLRTVPAGLVVAMAMFAAPAHASSELQSFVMDDDLLVYGNYQQRDAAMTTMRSMGVDGVRVTVSWKFVSGEQSGRPRRRPARLRGKRAEDPRNYRSDIWDRFDDIVRLGQANGIKVLLNPTGPGPVWANGRAPRSRRFDQPAWKPSPTAFRQFVVALGRRYSGTWVDENQDRSVLPRVVVWSIYNEPDQPASLSPQMEFNRKLHRQIPVAPILYREIYYAATAALRQTGHGDDLIMMGETAPLGAVRNTPRVHLWPKLFIREMFCVKRNGRPYTGLEARVRRCSELKRNGPFLVKAFAHHPYSQKNPPGRRDRFADSINMANIGDLPVLLDQLAATTGLIPQGLPIALTEIGWETRPPDPTRGVSLQHQAEWINIADHIAYDQPRVFINTQFVLRDVKPRAKYRGQRKRLSQYWATWQSGLLFANGQAKPAFQAFVMPFDVRRNGQLAQMWGQLRYLPNSTPGDVYLQFRPAGSSDWQSAGGPFHVDNPYGYWETQVAPPGPGVWRSVALVGDQPVTSREVSVSF